MSFSIRPTHAQDLAAIQSIYNAEVQQGLATWNEHIFPLQHFEQLLQQSQQQDFAFFVMQNDLTQEIVGYADYASFRGFTGYRFTVEHSIYIAPKYSRQGLGQRLLLALIEHAKARQLHSMVAAIDHENLASIGLHQKLGFKQTGYLAQVGYKFDTWRDLILMQLQLKA